MPTLESDFMPIGPYRMPGAGRDGVLRRRTRAIVRAIHHGDDCAVVAAWPCGGGRVRIRAQGATPDAAGYAIDRMRFGLNLDHDLRPFHAEFKRDPLIGPAIRRFPWIRPSRIADPFQALTWAITEQLIEVDRAFAIQRRLAFRYGRRSACGLVDAPSPAALAARAPAELQACDLSAGRSLALVMCAREVASGRTDLHAADHERAWARLLRIREIGPWTIEKLALHGQGRDDMLPAGDLAYIKLVGRLLDLGRRATVDEVRTVFAPYGEYAGLAGAYALAGARLRALPPPAPARTAVYA